MEAIGFNDIHKKFIIHHERPRSFQELAINLFRRNSSAEEFWALQGVSFAVEKGEAFGIVGENGSGKSTILKLITRILEPTRGHISVQGRVSALLELGAGFHPDLTGKDNIYLNASILGLSKKETDARFGEIVDFAELGSFIDTPLKHYSTGMQLRLGFAVAINTDPDILIADEVLSVGDEAFQRKCVDKIDAFMRQGKTILLVSHNLDLVRSLCARALWLEQGVVRAEGDAASVVQAYLDRVQQKSQAQAAQAPEATRRWGSREVELTQVELLNGEGEACAAFEAGGPLVARLHYYAHQRVHKPVFGIAIHYGDTIHLNGPNTQTGGCPIEWVEGPGVVEYAVPRLPLLRGTYHFSAAVYDHSRRHPYDHHDRLYPFRVQQRAVREDLGMIYMPSQWRHEPGARD